MITARRLRLWDGRYDLLEDERRVATWDSAHWSTGGRVEVDPAHGIGRRNWTIEVFAIAVALSRWKADAAPTG